MKSSASMYETTITITTEYRSAVTLRVLTEKESSLSEKQTRLSQILLFLTALRPGLSGG